MTLWEDFEKQDGGFSRFNTNPFDYELNDHIEQVGSRDELFAAYQS